MNRKSLLILVVLCAAAGLLAWLSSRPDSSSDTAASGLKAGDFLLADLKVDQIAGVQIVGPEAVTATLKRGEDNRWTIAERDYPIDGSRLETLLRDLAGLRVSQSQQAGPSQYGRLQLADPREEFDPESAATLIRLLNDKEAAITEIYIGKGRQDPLAVGMMMGGGAEGRFVRLAGNANQILLVSDAFSQVSASPSEWIVKRFFEPRAIQRISLAAGSDDFKPWSIARESETADFALEDAGPDDRPLQSSISSGLKSFLSFAQAADMLDDEAIATLDTSATRKLTLESFDGLRYEMEVTPMPADAESGGSASYAVRASVSGQYQEPPDPDFEIPQDADEEFAKALHESMAAGRENAKKEWEARLTREQALAGRVFKVNSWTLDPVWKSRDELFDTAAPANGNEAVFGEIDAALNPGDPNAGAPPRGPVSVTTEPIAIPLRPDPEDPEEKNDPESEDEEEEGESTE